MPPRLPACGGLHAPTAVCSTATPPQPGLSTSPAALVCALHQPPTLLFCTHGCPPLLTHAALFPHPAYALLQTTLLSILGGRAPKQTQQEGRVRFNDAKLTKRVKRQIGFVLQVGLSCECCLPWCGEACHGPLLWVCLLPTTQSAGAAAALAHTLRSAHAALAVHNRLFVPRCLYCLWTTCCMPHGAVVLTLHCTALPLCCTASCTAGRPAVRHPHRARDVVLCRHAAPAQAQVEGREGGLGGLACRLAGWLAWGWGFRVLGRHCSPNG